MASPEEINADMLAFWNGNGGDIWVARQEHTDITLAPVTNALLVYTAPRAGERVVDIGCVVARPRWNSRMPWVRPAAWRDWTFPDQCLQRVQGARAPPASSISIGGRPIRQRLRWTNTIC
jgi:hypothetical protein